MTNNSDAQRPGRPGRRNSRRRPRFNTPGSGTPGFNSYGSNSQEPTSFTGAASRESVDRRRREVLARQPEPVPINKAPQRAAARTVTHAGQPGIHQARPLARDRGAKQTSTAKLAARSWWMRQKPHVKRFGPPLLINYAIVLGVVLVIGTVVGIAAGFAIVPSVVAGLWMQLNLAPLHIDGVELGLAPLLPPVLLVWVHSRRMRKMLGDAISIRGLQVFTSLSLLIPLLITVVAWLMLWDASDVYPIEPPNLGTALLSALLVNGAATVIGLGPRIWRALLLRRGYPTWPVEAFRLASSFLTMLMLTGMLAAIVYALANLSAVRDTYSITEDTLGVVSLTLVALLYLPNIALGWAAVLMGGQYQIGSGAVSLFAVDNVNLPPLPVLAAVPHEVIPFGEWLMAVPALVALLSAYRFVRERDYIEAPLGVAAVAAVASAFIGFCLAWLSAGSLGVYGHTGPLEWLFGVEAFAWLLIPSAVLLVWVARSGSKVVEDIALESEPEPEPGDEVEDAEQASDAEGEDAETAEPDGGSADPEDPEDTVEEQASDEESPAEQSPDETEETPEPHEEER